MSNNKKAIKSKTVLTAPNPKRLGAFLIDQMVLYAVFALYFTLAGVSLEKPATALIYLGAVLITLLYRILYPTLISKGEYAGQTIGKRVMGIRALSADGTDVSIKAIAIRSVFMLIIEGFEIFAISYLLSAIALVGFTQIAYLAYMNIVIGIASIAFMIIKPSHQLLHDYIANTVVILVKQ